MKHLDGLIDTLGTACFAQRLLAALAELTEVDHLSLLRFEGDRCARLVLAASRPGWRFAQAAQQAYLEHFCTQDPNRGVFPSPRAAVRSRSGPAPAAPSAPSAPRSPSAPTSPTSPISPTSPTSPSDPRARPARTLAPTPATQIVLRRLRREDVPGADYRWHCYDAARLVDRLSVLSVQAGGGYALNLYRNAEHGPFTEAALAHIGERAAILAACCSKHDRFLPPDPQGAEGRPSVAVLDARLQALQPRLSRRESAVAARVLTGMTSDGIAVDLGVGLQSVLTYRKRAYAKLGIGGQRELLALLLGPQHAPSRA